MCSSRYTTNPAITITSVIKFASELRDYARLRALGIRMPELLDSDRTTERLLKEFIEGETVYEQALEDRVPDEYFAQLRGMCRVLYANGLNIDYFPTNFIGRADCCTMWTTSAAATWSSGTSSTGA